MGQSLSAVYLHLVFSTKNRRPFLADPETQAQMHQYLGGTSSKLGYAPVLVGGVEDHVHLLAVQSRTKTIANWVADLKSNSSKWIRTMDGGIPDFEWQGGYGVFSISQEHVERCRAYIENQEQHHRKISFEDELRAILIEHKIRWDEKFVWD